MTGTVAELAGLLAHAFTENEDPGRLHTQLLLTPAELRACGDVFDDVCDRLISTTEAREVSSAWVMANSLRTMFREAQYGAERSQ